MIRVAASHGRTTMTLGERCDEIVRLIDETLGSYTPVLPVARRHNKEAGSQDLEETLPRSA